VTKEPQRNPLHEMLEFVPHPNLRATTKVKAIPVIVSGVFALAMINRAMVLYSNSEAVKKLTFTIVSQVNNTRVRTAYLFRALLGRAPYRSYVGNDGTQCVFYYFDR